MKTRIHSLVTRFLRVLPVLLACLGSVWAGSAQFDEGNAKFAANDFAAAKRAYESAIQTGPLSANLFYNLGNTEFRLGNDGRAILNYERALALDPEHNEAKANLAYVQNKTGAHADPPGLLARTLHAVPQVAWVWIAVISGWVGLFTLVLRIGLWRSSGATAIAVCALLVSAGAIGALWVQRGDFSVAIVLRPATARLSPAESASEAAKLPAGSRVQVLQDHGAWMYCALPDRSRVWLPSATLERIHST